QSSLQSRPDDGDRDGQGRGRPSHGKHEVGCQVFGVNVEEIRSQEDIRKGKEDRCGCQQPGKERMEPAIGFHGFVVRAIPRSKGPAQAVAGFVCKRCTRLVSQKPRGSRVKESLGMLQFSWRSLRIEIVAVLLNGNVLMQPSAGPCSSETWV